MPWIFRRKGLTCSGCYCGALSSLSVQDRVERVSGGRAQLGHCLTVFCLRGDECGGGAQEAEQDRCKEEESEFGLGCFLLQLLPGHPGKRSSSVIGDLGPKPQRTKNPGGGGGIQKLGEVSEAIGVAWTGQAGRARREGS